MAARVSGPSTVGRAGRALRGAVVATLVVVVLGGAIAGCGLAAPTDFAATPSAAPQERISGAIELTRGVVELALKAADFGLIRPTVPFRPAESTALIDAPRGVFQVVLGDDPNGGFLVIYELPDPAAAYTAGLAQATWLASGPGAVQARPDTQYVIRNVGNTLVLFGWSPSNSPDARTAELAKVLESVGQGIPVSR